MTRKVTFLIFGVVIAALCHAKDLTRAEVDFDYDWKFNLQDAKEYAEAGFDDSGWQAVQLPHDWSIYLTPDSMHGGNGFFPGGIGWYRKTFAVPAGYAGRKVSILFDGVYHQSDVYINGEHLGFHPYGYIGFEYDLTPHLKYGKDNVIAVRVDHSSQFSSRWYSGSGIYRHVWLKVTDPVRVATWGTYITTPQVGASEANVRIVATIENNTPSEKSVTVENRIVDKAGKKISSSSSKVLLSANGKTDVEQDLQLTNPVLWSLSNPHLYRMLTIVSAGSKEIDRYESSFGVRTVEFDPNKGFFLNGENIKLKGFCFHQDFGCLGTAVPDRANIRKLEIIKEYGCNALRCSHNPPTPEFLDACDSLGFLVIDEAFDKWKSPWAYYTQYFDEWWQKDVSDMILRDRNHPSVILWSIGNETSEQNDPSGEGTARAKMIYEYVRSLEPSRKVIAAVAPSDALVEVYNQNGFADVFDVVGYNYQEPWYAEDHKNYPDRIILGTETFPFYYGRWGSTKRHYYVRDYFPRNPWYDVVENDYVSGGFIWTGIDYLGESMGWPSKGWPTGLFDVCMFEKPRAAFHRSMWNDEPMVRIAVQDQSLNIDPGKDHWSWPHLIDHWNFPQYNGHIIQVQTTTNCDEVELFINNASFGRRKRTDYTNNTIVWYVPYREGKVRSVGYNGNDSVAVYELNTAGKPVQIALVADRTNITADSQDISLIKVLLQDEKGVTVPDNDMPVTFEVTGAGRLIGVDNGDLRSSESYKGNRRTTYFGKALAIVQSSHKGGTITVRATAEGLKESVLTIISK